MFFSGRKRRGLYDNMTQDEWSLWGSFTRDGMMDGTCCASANMTQPRSWIKFIPKCVGFTRTIWPCLKKKIFCFRLLSAESRTVSVSCMYKECHRCLI